METPNPQPVSEEQFEAETELREIERLPSETSLLRRAKSILDRIVCLEGGQGATITEVGSAVSSDEPTLIREGDPLAMVTTVRNTGDSPATIYEAGKLVSIVPPRAEKELPARGRFELTAIAEALVDVTVAHDATISAVPQPDGSVEVAGPNQPINVGGPIFQGGWITWPPGNTPAPATVTVYGQIATTLVTGVGLRYDLQIRTGSHAGTIVGGAFGLLPAGQAPALGVAYPFTFLLIGQFQRFTGYFRSYVPFSGLKFELTRTYDDSAGGSTYLTVLTHQLGACGGPTAFLAPDNDPIGEFNL